MKKYREAIRVWTSFGTILIATCLVFGPLADMSQAAKDEAASKEKKVKYWKSPMDPSFISKAPGKDSMGMNLVPVYEGEETGGPPGSVRIDPATVQNIGVKTALVKRQKLAREIRTVGRIAYDETSLRRITPKVSGWIERQDVNFSGQVVEKGQPLLEIYSPDLVASQQEFLLALRYRARLQDSELRDALTGSADLVAAAEARLRYWDISDRQIEALRERGEITRTMVLHAPFKGIIVKKNALEGGFVKVGQDLYEIADITRVWVYADVYEYEVSSLRLGQEATMTLAYDPGKVYRGRVAYIYPYLQNRTRTLQVRLEFNNTADFVLKPDMWANVTIEAPLAGDSLAVPIDAVIRTGKRDVAFVALEGGRFDPRELKLGAEAGDMYQVLDGLSEGDRVVTSAQFLINSESNLRLAIAKMVDGAEGQESMTELENGDTPDPTMQGMKDMKGMKDMPGMKGMAGMKGMKDMPEAER